MKVNKARQQQVRACAGEEERLVRPGDQPAEHAGVATVTAGRPQRVRSSFADVCTDMYAKARGDLIWD